MDAALQLRQKLGRKRILVTDGAPCCLKLTSEHNLFHEACNHSKGIFCITKKKKWGNLLVHTGGIDGMWKISRGAVSSSWSTRKDGVVNPQLLQGIRGFGTGDGTMEIPLTSSVSQAAL